MAINFINNKNELTLQVTPKGDGYYGRDGLHNEFVVNFTEYIEATIVENLVKTIVN